MPAQVLPAIDPRRAGLGTGSRGLASVTGPAHPTGVGHLRSEPRELQRSNRANSHEGDAEAIFNCRRAVFMPGFVVARVPNACVK
jgi:hypothetical protein